MNFRKIFQSISYLQYPLMLIGLFYALVPYLKGFDYLKENPDIIFENYNYTLIFMGLGISISTLQDTTKTQNNFSKKIWENPKKGKVAIGIFGYFISVNEKLQQLSIGILIFGIGLIGFLKTALEVFENHRLDKNVAPKS
ncbi:hypothetical protein DSM03_103423 [Leeuwenhoekiella aestuarii]|uniref:Uncharacterized protein n=1 Tax=Leeuwenhoekiella aestuarii TaxID=2249426 RepID=A0A4Q0NXP4_9FLAO|nr:hypothetical protein [Leeuwenhoekiella aestuarii]RXG16237.1 hypothetical protein DSM03_103423 [Leeuwenhoekiella aestuarii]RXG16930.1 hypothetical protein DSM04_102512 [Leeuwenhoekiella aestuarii]